jgi:plasmid stability protein
MMAELVLTEVNERILYHLRARAAGHGRTPEEEAKAILSDALEGEEQDVWAQVDALYRHFTASARTFSDSADLLREDRDR